MLLKNIPTLLICLSLITESFGQIKDCLILKRQTQIDSILIVFPDSVIKQREILITGANIDNLKAFNNIHTIKGNVIIKNTSIDSLVGLENLKLLYTLELDSNYSLQYIAKFKYLIDIRSLSIKDCPVLKSLDFIEAIETLGNLEIFGNTQNLKKISNLSKLKQLYNFSLISNVGMDTVQFSDDLEINDIIIYGNQNLIYFYGANNKNNLSNSDDGYFRCNSLFISDNNKLSYINCSNKTHCFDQVNISNNPFLQSLTVGEFSDSIALDVEISSNKTLEYFTALNNIKSSRFVNITNNENLKELNCFKNLKSTLNISISKNPTLQKLYGAFANVDTLGQSGAPKSGLSIYLNKKLNSIEEFSNVKYFNSVAISLNKRLGLCSIKSICNHIETGRPIELDADNAPGCRSINQIRLGCTSYTENVEKDLREFELYPNPTTDRVTVQGSDIHKIDIIHPDGKLMKHIEADEISSQEIDISSLPPAVYIVIVTYGPNHFTKALKCIKI